jgi:hypothetical protein
MTKTITVGRAADVRSGTGNGARLDRLAGLGPDRMTRALAFLAECHPDAFDLALDAAEPAAVGREPDLEPVCLLCGERVGIFAARGENWTHYMGNGVTTAEPYEAGHGIVIVWQPADDAAVWCLT